ncbi:MAG: glycosyltransferase, partial [Syntrophomonadaceae bacterium]|nr:glycosyltransferase [Syntrophomonadaceae bacterium]
PPGWNGKPWACWQGAQRARSPLLLFLDADTELEDNGLARIVEEYRRERGPLSVQPWHAMERPFEQLSAFFNIVLMMGTHVFTPLGRRLAPRAFFGPCQVMSRQEYQAVGGHQAVKGSVLEDLALGRAFAAAGLPVRCMGGRGAIRFRMYGGGVRELVEGWSKGFAAGAGSTGLVPLLLTVLWVSGAAGSTVSLLQAPLNGQPLLQPLAFYLLFGLQVYWMLARIGSFSPLQVVLFPLPLLFFVLVFARALVVTYGLKRVKWKGRVISTRGK